MKIAREGKETENGTRKEIERKNKGKTETSNIFPRHEHCSLFFILTK
jgi:hypothetical protein